MLITDAVRYVLVPFLIDAWIVLGAILACLVIQHAVREVLFVRSRRLERRYRPLLEDILLIGDSGDGLAVLQRAPRIHRPVISKLLVEPLRVVRGEPVDRARELARRLQLTPAWIRDLTHRRWWRRAEAALALGFTQESSSYDGLIARLDDHHEEVRAAAVEALGRLGDLRAVPELLARLPEQSRHQRARIVDAIGALGHTGAADIVAYARRCPEQLPLLKELLVSVAGTAAAPDLLGWVASDLPATRSAALWALGTIGVDETSFPHARRALSDDVDEVRAMAARALGRSRREDAVPLLAASLEDIWVVSAFSAQALSELGTAGLAALRARAWEEGPAGDLARHVLWEKQSAA